MVIDTRANPRAAFLRSGFLLVALCWAAAGFAAASVEGNKKPAQAPRQPQPSELMPLADHTIVNDMARAGDHLVAVGARGDILLSRNGKTWHQVVGPVRSMLTRVVFRDNEHGWAVGWDGAILHTSDGGRHWDLVNFDPQWGKPYFDVMPTGPGAAVVIGSNGRMRITDDAGKTWRKVDNDVFATGFHLYEIDALADGTLLIAGERGMLARSIDGSHWDMLVPPYIGSYFGVIPWGPHGAVLYGLQGRVFVAEDVRTLPALDKPMAYSPFTAKNITDAARLAAMGWRQIRNPVEESLYGASLDSSGRLILVGVDGSIVAGQVTDSELQAQDSPTTDPLSDVLVQDHGLLLSGRNGFYHGKLPGR
ncbi:MAG: YCF48-related protein [Salinisphaera sp.]|nr:YCF48-related protein [Salinisphaera sp.]